MNTCPKCGSVNEESNATCSSCGLDLSQVTPTQAAPPRPSTTVNTPPPTIKNAANRLPESKLGQMLLIGAFVAPFTGIGLLAGPIIWILAVGEKNKIARGELAPSGAVTGALILGVLETLVLVIGLVIGFGLLIDLLSGPSYY